MEQLLLAEHARLGLSPLSPGQGGDGATGVGIGALLLNLAHGGSSNAQLFGRALSLLLLQPELLAVVTKGNNKGSASVKKGASFSRWAQLYRGLGKGWAKSDTQGGRGLESLVLTSVVSRLPRVRRTAPGETRGWDTRRRGAFCEFIAEQLLETVEAIDTVEGLEGRDMNLEGESEEEERGALLLSPVLGSHLIRLFSSEYAPTQQSPGSPGSGINANANQTGAQGIASVLLHCQEQQVLLSERSFKTASQILLQEGDPQLVLGLLESYLGLVDGDDDEDGDNDEGEGEDEGEGDEGKSMRRQSKGQGKVNVVSRSGWLFLPALEALARRGKFKI